MIDKEEAREWLLPRNWGVTDLEDLPLAGSVSTSEYLQEVSEP